MSFGYCVNVVVLELLRWSINILFPSSFIEGCLIWRTWNSVGKKPFNWDFCETKEYRYILNRFELHSTLMLNGTSLSEHFFQPLLFPSEYLEVKCGRGSMLGILFGFAVCSVTHQYSENKAMRLGEAITESPPSQGNRRPLNSIASIATWIQHVLHTIWGNSSLEFIRRTKNHLHNKYQDNNRQQRVIMLYLYPWSLTWNIIMKVWFRSFSHLFFRWFVRFPTCSLNPKGGKNQPQETWTHRKRGTAMAPKVDAKAKAKAAGKAAARKISQAKIQKPGISVLTMPMLMWEV